MTGILTKKNVEDGAFVNSNSGNDNNDYESIYVKDDVIVDGDMILGGISVKSQLVNHEERITAIENKDMTIYAKKDEIPDLTPYVKKDEITTVDLSPYYTSAQVEEKFVDEDELAYEFNKYETKEVAEEKYALKTDIPTVDLELYAKKTDIPTVDLELYAKKTDIPTVDLELYAKKTDIPTIDLEPYAKKTDIPTIDLEPYALKTEIPEIPNDLVKETALENYVPKEGDSTIQGSLTINNNDNYPLKLLNENMTEITDKMNIILGKSETDENAIEISYLNLGGLNFGKINKAYEFSYTYDTGFRLYNNTNIRGRFLVENIEENLLTALRAKTGETQCNIMFGLNRTRNVKFDYVGQSNGSSLRIFVDNVFAYHYDNIDNVKHTTINGNLIVRGTITSANSTTITHLAPIEAGEEISDFKIGKPVFMSGHVYKRENSTWISSSATDSTDCICSVTIDGTWKEFVGIISNVDKENGNITFATHGDYLFYVDDANIYAIGDVLLYDGRILDEDYAMTLKIQQSIVGKVSAKINEHTLALFKS